MKNNRLQYLKTLEAFMSNETHELIKKDALEMLNDMIIEIKVEFPIEIKNIELLNKTLNELADLIAKQVNYNLPEKDVNESKEWDDLYKFISEYVDFTIFVELHQKYNTMSGDIDPMDSFRLSELYTQITDQLL